MNTKLTRTHSLSAKLHEDGMYKAVFISMRNDVIKSGSWLLKIPVKVSPDFKGEGLGRLQGCRFANNQQVEDEYLQPDYFKVFVAPTELQLSSTALELKPDETETLTVTYEPATAAPLPLTWESSNPEAATVDNEGVVKAIANGVTVITVSLTDDPEIKAECKVTVDDSNSSLDAIEIVSEGADVYTLSGVLLYKNASAKTLGTLPVGIYILGGKKVQIK